MQSVPGTFTMKQVELESLVLDLRRALRGLIRSRMKRTVSPAEREELKHLARMLEE